ncbi:hypothetical protein GCM10009430_31940 [Aquimarina litoralis]|uniref:Uncharacterized protein n=1 Tax=Aquimarina litoralis TaxID=584605 RepID=A0ABP3U6X2_9FLAO
MINHRINSNNLHLNFTPIEKNRKVLKRNKKYYHLRLLGIEIKLIITQVLL